VIESASLSRRLIAITAVVALAATLVAFVWRCSWQALIVLLLSSLLNPVLAAGLFPGIWRRRGKPPPAPCDDLARRRPVWSALSELYLDTELAPADHARIASKLVESGYSAEQLEEILYRELHPLLHANLLSVAGEWAGFAEQWLENRILARGRRRAGFAIVPGKWMVRREWQALQVGERITDRRALPDAQENAR